MKYSIIFIMIILLTGCNISKINNTPKKKVEEYLYQYQSLSDSVLADLQLTAEKEIELDDTFEMIVDSLYVERIGENDESIKLYDIKLK